MRPAATAAAAAADEGRGHKLHQEKEGDKAQKGGGRSSSLSGRGRREGGDGAPHHSIKGKKARKKGVSSYRRRVVRAV